MTQPRTHKHRQTGETIQAARWDGTDTHAETINTQLGGGIHPTLNSPTGTPQLRIHDQKGPMTVFPGQYVYRHANGQLDRHYPEIFEATYDPTTYVPEVSE